jgi:quinol monooxygenase YgiN
MKFGTIARYKVKPGHADRFLSAMSGIEDNPPAGWNYATVFRSTTDPNEIWMTVVFESEEAYKSSANSPDMDRMYQENLKYLDGEPEWHDGHVIQEAMRKPATA